MADQPNTSGAEPVYDPADFGEPSTSSALASAPTSADPTSSFPSDPNISFSQVTGKWVYEDPNTGVESEYDEQLGKWRQLVDEEEWKAQQGAYGVEGVDEDRPAAPVIRREKKKRKIQDLGGTDPNSIDGNATGSTQLLGADQMAPNRSDGAAEAEDERGSAKSKTRPARRERVNTSLFISSLPLDATQDEVAKVFSRYGILAESDDGSPRVKLYTDDKTGMFKGEALLTFFKAESCQLAIQLLDGTCLRAAEGKSTPLMKVQMADWSGKETEGSKTETVKPSNGNGAHANPEQGSSASKSTAASAPSASTSTAGPSAKKPRNEQDKKKAAKRYARMNEKLAGWESSSDEETSASLRPSGAQAGYLNPLSRTLILKRIFTLSELSSDPSLLLDLSSDIREECANFGEVTSVTLWDLEPEGVVSVKFRKGEEAQAALKVMDGRFFAGRRIEAFLSEGNKVKFRRSRGEAAGLGEESDEEGAEKKDGFGEWLEGEGDQET
ncbi:hypothetical protein BCV69DRAFT_294165 [Microstroma glucosiphilum]|uniref:RRM domain-containing protein n=1 Tax=Pseudomicrostroma glucosiphilum TaxID=1684307 RepID=A0A316U5H4_9BASI|nr:hypothetical protein BCV69DRAFT_294165 [Pseudomicrostroma glucosiphilum]PWN20479.1 hypothetical protein BCV69DRAFT_294165 [Pseudomicrostroma glucosiphilum]